MCPAHRQAQLDEIRRRLDRTHNEPCRLISTQLPVSLDLEAQGRFALGYYHQKADYRRRSAERKEALKTAAAEASKVMI